MTGVIKTTKLSIFQNKQIKKELTWVKLVNIINFCGEEVAFISDDVNKLTTYYQ